MVFQAHWKFFVYVPARTSKLETPLRMICTPEERRQNPHENIFLKNQKLSSYFFVRFPRVREKNYIGK